MPPLAVKSIEPLDEPLQAVGVTVVDNTMEPGSVIVADVVAVQPFASVTVTV